MNKTRTRIALALSLVGVGLLSATVVPHEELLQNKPAVTLSNQGNNVMLLEWPSIPQVYYYAEGSDDLKTWISVKLLTDLDPTDGLMLATQIAGPKAFYRLQMYGDTGSSRLREDSDGDGLIDLLEADAGWDAFETEDPTDSDQDGIPDYWEQFHFSSLEHDSSYTAVEGGLTLTNAFTNATDPRTNDSDGDGFSDAYETANGRDPNYNESRDDKVTDTDGDGLSDWLESRRGTDATLGDSDNDGVNDLEDAVGYDPFFTFDAAPETLFAVIDLGALAFSSQRIMDLANNGTVVLSGQNDSFNWVPLGGISVNINIPSSRYHAADRMVLSNNGSVVYHADADGLPKFTIRNANGQTSTLDYSGYFTNLSVIISEEHQIVEEENGTESWTNTLEWRGSEWASILALLDDGNLLYRQRTSFSWFYGYYNGIGTSGELIEGTVTRSASSDVIYKAGTEFQNTAYTTVGNIEYNYGVAERMQIDLLEDMENTFSYEDETFLVASNRNGDWATFTDDFKDFEYWDDPRDTAVFKFSDGTSIDRSFDHPEHGAENGLEAIGRLPGQEGLWKSWDAPSLSLVGPSSSNVILSRKGGSSISVTKIADNGLLLPSSESWPYPFNLWQNGRILTDSEIFGSNSSWSDLNVAAISDNGAFVAGTANKDGATHAVLLLKVDLEWQTLDGKTADEDDDDQLENFVVPADYSNYSTKNLDWLKGLRYFTGGENQQATFNRTKINLKVSIPGLAGKTVKLKAFDVDDTTPSEWNTNGDIDDSDTAGDDNNLNWIPNLFAGRFTDTQSSTTTATLDADGEVIVEFNTSSHPGSNYRVAVTLDNFSTELDALQVSDSSADNYVAADDEQVSDFPGAVSPLLTVWRKLHIEVDSMTARPSSGESGGYYTGTISDYEEDPQLNQSTLTLSRTLPGDDNRFEFGRIEIEGFTRIEVRGNTDHWIDGEEVLIKEKPGATVIGKSFTIYDDDGLNLDDLGIGAMLPYTEHAELITAVKPKYAPSFIEIIDANALGLNDEETIPFDLNSQILGTPLLDSLDNAKDVEDSSFFWAHTVIFAFEPKASLSIDPAPADGEFLSGGTPEQYSHGYSVVYVEIPRDEILAGSYPDSYTFTPAVAESFRNSIFKKLWGTVAHEIAHSPRNNSEGSDHGEEGLMKEGGAVIKTDFTTDSLKRFRNASSWTE